MAEKSPMAILRRAVVWQQPMLPNGPPGTKRRRDTEPEHKHSNAEWEQWRDRITELFEDHELTDVATMMDQEGFKASIPQYRHHLKKWGHWKYLRLTEKQWQFVGKNLLAREEEGKETGFRLSGKHIPSSKIERGLVEKIDEGTFDEVALLQSAIRSESDLSVYTVSTGKGISLTTKASLSRLRRVDSKNSSRSPLPSLGEEKNSAEPRTVPDAASFIIRRFLNESSRRTSVASDLKARADVDGNVIEDIWRHSSDSPVEEYITNRIEEVEKEKDNLQSQLEAQQEKYDKLCGEWIELSLENRNVKCAKEKVEKERDDLQKERDDLQKERDNLQKQKDNLELRLQKRKLKNHIVKAMYFGSLGDIKKAIATANDASDENERLRRQFHVENQTSNVQRSANDREEEQSAIARAEAAEKERDDFRQQLGSLKVALGESSIEDSDSDKLANADAYSIADKIWKLRRLYEARSRIPSSVRIHPSPPATLSSAPAIPEQVGPLQTPHVLETAAQDVDGQNRMTSQDEVENISVSCPSFESTPQITPGDEDIAHKLSTTAGTLSTPPFDLWAKELALVTTNPTAGKFNCVTHAEREAISDEPIQQINQAPANVADVPEGSEIDGLCVSDLFDNRLFA